MNELNIEEIEKLMVDAKTKYENLVVQMDEVRLRDRNAQILRDFYIKEVPHLLEIISSLLNRVEELEDGWVSVEDALPHEEGAVICYFSDGVIETFMFDRHDVDGIWGAHNVVVTHWQPLPAPPMEKDDE